LSKKIIYILIPIIVIVSILIYFILPIESKRNIKIPSNNSIEVANYLSKQGYNVGFLDSLFLTLINKPIKGWVYINSKKLPRYKFLLALGRKESHYKPITIIPGETSYFTLKDIANKLDMNQTLLEKYYLKSAKYKEGNFIANTYNIPIYFNEQETIKFLLKNSYKIYKKTSIKYFGNFSFKEFKKIIIIASIIQKEAANQQEMPLIASVIFNRLHKNMRLQMDGTLNYGIYSHTKVTPKRIKGDTSSYNTYKHKGLPKEAICNVSLNAILAAIKPEKTNYLYFMRSKNGHRFSSDYKEHIKNIKLRKKELLLHQWIVWTFDVAISFIIKADFWRTRQSEF